MEKRPPPASPAQEDKPPANRQRVGDGDGGPPHLNCPHCLDFSRPNERRNERYFAAHVTACAAKVAKALSVNGGDEIIAGICTCNRKYTWTQAQLDEHRAKCNNYKAAHPVVLKSQPVVYQRHLLLFTSDTC